MNLAAGSPPLPGIFHTFEPILTHYGYLAVAGILFLEDFGVPAPGETVLIAAAVYAGAGRLSVVGVAVVAFLAAVAGDNVGFAIGHYGGRPLALRLGRYVRLTPQRLDRAQRWFAEHGAKIVAVARFVEGLRQANGIVAGISRMHWARFLAFNALGAALWVATWTTVGVLFGSHIDSVYGILSKVFRYVVIAVIVLVVFRLIIRRRRRHEADSSDDRSPDDDPATSENHRR